MTANKLQLPPFAVDLDAKFRNYERVFVLGDLHDSEDQFRIFLLHQDAGFILYNGGGDDEDGATYSCGLANMYVKPRVLLVFLGDVLYKTKNHFKSIARFILRNRENCLLILGNNEVKFVFERIKLFLDVARPFLRRSRFKVLRNQIVKAQGCKLLHSIYTLISWFRTTKENNELKRSWRWYYDCMFREYEQENGTASKDSEETMILMYILTESIVLGYSDRLKLILLHAGLNPNRSIRDQLVTDVCNIRNVRRSDIGEKPWFRFFEKIDYTILFGHWSALTRGDAKPFFFSNTVCIDTGCCRTNVLSFATFRPRDMVGPVRPNVVEMTKINKFVFHSIALLIT